MLNVCSAEATSSSPHVRSRLSAQTTCSILCLGAWSLLGLVKNDDVVAAAQLLELDGKDSDYECVKSVRSTSRIAEVPSAVRQSDRDGQSVA
jgi:hypothetical protein